MRPYLLLLSDFLPQRKDASRRRQAAGRFRGVPRDFEHVGDLLAESGVRVFGEPLRRQIVRRESVLEHAIDLDAQPHDAVRRVRHRRDAVAKRHPQRQIANEEPKFANGDFHGEPSAAVEPVVSGSRCARAKQAAPPRRGGSSQAQNDRQPATDLTSRNAPPPRAVAVRFPRRDTQSPGRGACPGRAHLPAGGRGPDARAPRPARPRGKTASHCSPRP